MSAPHLAKVKAAAILRLSDEKTDQVIVITAQGTQVGIAMAVSGGTSDTWATALRDIADQLEAGELTTADEFFDECDVKPS